MSNPIDFLMEGDPAIRWQCMRDLLGCLESEWQAERMRMLEAGWARQMVGAQSPDGNWPAERWTGNVWTLTLLVEMGIPPGDFGVKGFERVVERLMPKGQASSPDVLKTRMDLCHLGFWLRIGSRFCPSDTRLAALTEVVLSLQMADGGWNCRIRVKPKVSHSSFHTTFNILEGLREAADAGVLDRARFAEAEARAIEFMLEHRLYRSDKTGEIVNDRFLELSYPSYWHYTVLRGLVYIQATPFIKDERLADPIEWLESRRKPNGLWPVEKRIPGVTLFDMERMGGDSRWNTLRALRVLRARTS